ncbi:MAG: AraC family transcriptional regulator [Treponema sp.]|nr:AraC family transcriptional regulator [Treponema sp.]
MNVNKKIYLEGKAVTVQLDGKHTFPHDYGKIGIDSVKKHNNIVYRSWNIQFNKDIAAEEQDNAGLDEVQIMFNINHDISWFVKNKQISTIDSHSKVKEKVEMGKGEVCIFRNNDYSTGMTYAADITFKFKSMQMPTSFFRTLLSKFFSTKDIRALETQFLIHVTKTSITPEMFKVLSEIDTSDRFKEYEGIYLESKMIELTALVLYGIAYHKTEEIQRLAVPNKKDTERIELLREQIQRQPADEYDAPSVASSLGMSVSKLNRSFRTLYGTSLHAYVQDKRLEYAAHLIQEHNFAISEAAQKAGYTNMSHFSKSFSKKYGMLPKHFLEKNKQRHLELFISSH